jgi:hypothetical protein
MTSKRENPGKGWSQKVTKQSYALDLEKGVFSLEDPAEIAASLKRSAEASRRRKSDPYRSPMSMLTFSTSTAPARACRRATARGWNRPRSNCAMPSGASSRSDPPLAVALFG